MFDGLETLFSQNLVTTCLALLKAINNRKYIYFVSLRLEYSAMKEQERRAQEEKGTKNTLHYNFRTYVNAHLSLPIT